MSDTDKPLNIPGVKISPATEGCLLGIPVDPWTATAHGAMLHALLKRTEALEAMLAEYLVMEVENDSITHRDPGGDWFWIPDGQFARDAADRLVELGLWEKHPTISARYRPIERTA